MGLDHGSAAPAALPAPLDSVWIEGWDPEDANFWRARGRSIAARNLVFSILAEFLAFCVWQMWSAIAARLPDVGYRFSVNQLFWLAAVPGLSGATLRIPYSFAVGRFGGRNWTLVSTLLLLVPVLGIGFALRRTDTPYGVFLGLALCSGFGGGNFASSMANIHYFFPQRLKGTALGVNAGGGNIGVSVVQFLVPLAVTWGWLGRVTGSPERVVVAGAARVVWLQNAAFLWVPAIAVSLVGTALYMNNLRVASEPLAGQFPVLRRGHTWSMAWLYIGTFGSFIGYSAGFPLLIKSQFPGVNPLAYAFLGPLLGSAIRPFGGWWADRWGGAKVTFATFAAMLAATLGVVFFLDHKGEPWAFGGFFGLFLVLFMCTGIGNGSVYRMIPAVFRGLGLRDAGAPPEGSAAHRRALEAANRRSATALGFVSAVGAYGAFLVPKGYGTSIALTGGPQAALLVFCLFYATCLALTAARYLGRGAAIPC